MALAPKGGWACMLPGAATLVAVALMLLWPALWNGYPLLYHDTEDYVNMSFTFDLVIWRTMPYALVMAIGRLFNSLWAVAALQALLAAWVLHEAAAAFAGRRRAVLLGGAAILALLTSLPWTISLLMPDAFTALVPLGIAVLAFGRALPRPRRIVLLLPVTLAIACHLSHLGVAAGLAAALVVLRVATQFYRPALRPMLALAVLAPALGAAAVLGIHLLTTGQAVFSQAGRVLQLALFVQDGLAKRYLDKVCPQGAALKLCPYRDQFPKTADAFLWAPWATPFWKVGGWVGMKDEAASIVAGTMREFPGAVAQAALGNVARQLSGLSLGDGLDPKRRARAGEYYETGWARYPDEFRTYLTARQQRAPGIDFAPINAVQTPLAWAALGLLVLLLAAAWQRRDAAGTGLAAMALLAILGNGIICGAVSNPHDRYQNRIVWLAAAADLLLLARMRYGRAVRLAGQPAALAGAVAAAAAPARSFRAKPPQVP